MSNSERAMFMAGTQKAKSGVSGIAERDKPISELFRVEAEKWVDEDAAASILEELKTTTLEKMKSRLMQDAPMADNRAERLAKCLPEWEQYLRDMVTARQKANGHKIQMKYLEIKHREWIGRDATARAEMKL